MVEYTLIRLNLIVNCSIFPISSAFIKNLKYVFDPLKAAQMLYWIQVEIPEEQAKEKNEQKQNRRFNCGCSK